mmetsp:Transcript_41783/g.63812  ORF Transcript_41783/g.63812 Transcript_41783/m.63812 type:complete len:148 (+) Transcript_41783:617-1060(+)
MLSGGSKYGGADSNVSGNVTNILRKVSRMEAEGGCDRKEVKVEDEKGKLVTKKVRTEKMTKVQSFFATCKSYCAINVLLIPKAFQNGGYILSPIALVISGFLQLLCAIKLTECGMHVKKISYPDIVHKAMGRKGKKVLEVFLAIVQF